MRARLVYDPTHGRWRLEEIKEHGETGKPRVVEIVWVVDSSQIRRELEMVPAGAGVDVVFGIGVPRDLLDYVLG